MKKWLLVFVATAWSVGAVHITYAQEAGAVAPAQEWKPFTGGIEFKGQAVVTTLAWSVAPGRDLPMEKGDFGGNGIPKAETNHFYTDKGALTGRMEARYGADGRLLQHLFYGPDGKLRGTRTFAVADRSGKSVSKLPPTPEKAKLKFGAESVAYRFASDGHPAAMVYTDAEGRTRTSTYTSQGKLQRSTRQLPHAWKTDTLADEKGRLLRTTITKDNDEISGQYTQAYDRQGRLAQFVTREAGKPVSRMVPHYNAAGKESGMSVYKGDVLKLRVGIVMDKASDEVTMTTEEFDDAGVLEYRTISKQKKDLVDMTRYDSDGELDSRKVTALIGEGKERAPKIIREEQGFGEDGKTITVWDKDGNNPMRTYYDSEGKVIWTKPVNPDGSVTYEENERQAPAVFFFDPKQ